MIFILSSSYAYHGKKSTSKPKFPDYRPSLTVQHLHQTRPFVANTNFTSTALSLSCIPLQVAQICIYLPKDLLVLCALFTDCNLLLAPTYLTGCNVFKSFHLQILARPKGQYTACSQKLHLHHGSCQRNAIAQDCLGSSVSSISVARHTTVYTYRIASTLLMNCCC